MKIEVKDIEVKKTKVFHPFKIELLIEDESDLEDLAVRFSAPQNIEHFNCCLYGIQSKGFYGYMALY